MKVTDAFLRRVGFIRVVSKYGGGVCWSYGDAIISKPHPTIYDVLAAVYHSGHCVGYAKAQTDMQNAAKAFLGPLGLLPDARAQQMTKMPPIMANTEEP